MTRTDTDSRAADNARAHLEGIQAAHLAVEWLRSNCRDGNDLNTEARALLRECGWPDADADAVADAIEDRMREAPLSVEVRSEWQSAGESLVPAEFRVVLSTGGPACQLIGEVSTYNGAGINARIQYQDWFTLWSTLDGVSTDQEEALEWFAGLFTYEA